MSTHVYPPYLLARAAATLDHVTRGRMGWNIVTSSLDIDAAELRFELYSRDRRNATIRADEYMDVVEQLWGSWARDRFSWIETPSSLLI